HTRPYQHRVIKTQPRQRGKNPRVEGRVPEWTEARRPKFQLIRLCEVLLEIAHDIEVVELVKPTLASERAGGIKGQEILSHNTSIQRLFCRDKEIPDPQCRDEQPQRDRCLPKAFAKAHRLQESECHERMIGRMK